MITKAYDSHVAQLFDVIRRAHAALSSAGVDYRIVGGFAVYLHINEIDELAARLTKDIDIAIQRADLPRIAAAAIQYGFTPRDADLVDAIDPKRHSAVHFVFVREKVRPDYLEAVPDFSTPTRTTEGLLLDPIPDLLRMKLTSLRLKDKVHIIDMDGVGLITAEIEAALPEVLRQRLQQVRAEDHQ